MANIIGLFDTRRDAESAVQQLVNSGIIRDLHQRLIIRVSSLSLRDAMLSQ
jgi:hypothetical protein